MEIRRIIRIGCYLISSEFYKVKYVILHTIKKYTRKKIKPVYKNGQKIEIGDIVFWDNRILSQVMNITKYYIEVYYAGVAFINDESYFWSQVKPEELRLLSQDEYILWKLEN